MRSKSSRSRVSQQRGEAKDDLLYHAMDCCGLTCAGIGVGIGVGVVLKKFKIYKKSTKLQDLSDLILLRYQLHAGNLQPKLYMYNILSERVQGYSGKLLFNGTVMNTC